MVRSPSSTRLKPFLILWGWVLVLFLSLGTGRLRLGREAAAVSPRSFPPRRCLWGLLFLCESRHLLGNSCWNFAAAVSIYICLLGRVLEKLTNFRPGGTAASEATAVSAHVWLGCNFCFRGALVLLDACRHGAR